VKGWFHDSGYLWNRYICYWIIATHSLGIKSESREWWKVLVVTGPGFTMSMVSALDFLLDLS
jgi:hypothetical protein